MLLRSDFAQRATVSPEQHQWVASPQHGVERMMLDRMGEERARATSIVRYAPGACFPRHEHPGGEEILVLAGTFSDEAHDYPAGWYLRNPPGSAHRPSSRDGATLFVKLWQMTSRETQAVRVDTRDPSRWLRGEGRESHPLFADDTECVSLQRLVANALLFREVVTGGAELLILEGGLMEGTTAYPRGSWLRLPDGELASLLAGPDGATLYLKTGHLSAARTSSPW